MGIIAILSMSYITTRILKTYTSVAKIPRVPVGNKITTLSVVKIAIKFSPCIYNRFRLELWNKKWQIQYGGHQIENSINFCDTLHTGVFGVAHYESKIRFSKFKITDPIWRMPNRKFHQFFWYFVLGGFSGR